MNPVIDQTVVLLVRSLRTGHDGIAGLHLTFLLDLLQEQLAKGLLPPDPRILQGLSEALTRQERSDFIGLADVMEYELAPMLREISAAREHPN